LADVVPTVLDLHHHFVRDGVYITPDDARIARIIDSWRGVRPALHYSVSRDDYLVAHDVNTKPDMNLLLESGHKKAKLRAHSDFMWNKAVNEWAYEHWQWADCQVEAKGKNLASFALFKFWKSLKN
jgi:UV DNA damage repair endonuclease